VSDATAIRCPCGACFDGCCRNVSQAIVLGEQLKTLIMKESDSAQFAVSPNLPIHRARRPIRDAAGSHTEGGAPDEWARYRLGSYTIIDRQDGEMDFCGGRAKSVDND
jgi:hypothetical protein